MSMTIPFTYNIQLYPTLTFTTRMERVRELERWGNMIAEALSGSSRSMDDATFPTAYDISVNLASPGGGCSRSFGRFGWMFHGVAVKPAFGQTPAQCTLVGFYDPETVPHPVNYMDIVSSTNPQEYNAYNQTYADTQVFCCNSVKTGPMGYTVTNKPDPSVDAEVASLRTNIEYWITSGMPGNFKFTTYRIELRGVIYGYGGFTFPQSGIVSTPITGGIFTAPGNG